jgi:hypothetical protein
LEQLIESIVPAIRATNEPKRQSCGAPDYILTKKDNLSRSDSGIPVGFIEAKDIGDKDLEGAKKTGKKEQFEEKKVRPDGSPDQNVFDIMQGLSINNFMKKKE